MSDDEGNKHLSLFELIEDEDFQALGVHEENEYSAEVDKQTVKEAAAVEAEALHKEHSNNYILWKFKFVDEPADNQTVLPSKFNTEANKTAIGQHIYSAFTKRFKKGKTPTILETDVTPIGAKCLFESNKAVTEILKVPHNYRLQFEVTLTSKRSDKGYSQTSVHRVCVDPVPYGTENGNDHCFSVTFVEPMISWPTSTEPFFELKPASEAMLKRAANTYGPNTQKGTDYEKDKHFLGDGEFSMVSKSSMTFWYKDPPVIEIMPRHNVYHPDDMSKAAEERRIIGSLKNTVRCYQLDRYNVCGDCKCDRMGWVEDQQHDCIDPGPANPSMRRQKSKVRYGAKHKGNWRKFRKGTVPGINTPAKMPEHHLSQPTWYEQTNDSLKPRHKQQKRMTQIDSTAMSALMEQHSDIHPDTLSTVLSTILELSPDKDGIATDPSYANGDPMAILQARHPTIEASVLAKIVSTILSMPAEGMLGKRSAATDLSPDSKVASTSSNNQFALLEGETPLDVVDSNVLTELTQ